MEVVVMEVVAVEMGMEVVQVYAQQVTLEKLKLNGSMKTCGTF